MSFWMMPKKPMNKAVMAPTSKTTFSAVSDNSNKGDMRATIKIPAVTMVAAWMSAEMGVGPSIESGNHTCKGNCADLPMAPINKQMQATVSSIQLVPGRISVARSGALAKISV